MDWQVIEDIFSRALELDGPARISFLEQDFHSDMNVRGKVRQLVEAHEKCQTLWANEKFAELTGPVPEMPDSIGDYQIEKEIGHGGMGRVFLASRTKHGVTHQVAIKILRKEAESMGLTRRFLNEFRILSGLNHSGIVQLHDFGNDQGWFYFVMEFVNGVPITTYCDNKKLSFEQRLALFQRVCDVLSFAHFNLITHRDIKPDNILVTDQGEVKLLDFGIAGLHDPSVENTKTTKMIFTPEYASPEQFLGQPITTATDIYSLGVLLFEMIVGRLPYDSVNRSSPFLYGKTVCEKPPLSPTGVLEHVSQKEVEEIAENRSLTVGKLRAVFESDLMFIVRKCLRKAPLDRYHSCQDLKNDIQNYQEKRRVIARKGSFTYTCHTFIKRNLLVSFLMSALISVVLGMSVFHYFSVKRERDFALKEWNKAQHTSQFLTRLFEQTNPNITQKGAMTAKDVLNNGLASIQSELDHFPEVKLTLYKQIGGIFRLLDGFQEARDVYDQAEKLAEKLKDQASLSDIAHGKGMLFLGQKKYPEAEQMFQKTLLFSEMEVGDIADVKISLGNAFTQQGKFEQAEAVLNHIEIPEGEDSTYNRKMAYESALGALCFLMRRDEEAYEHYTDAIGFAILNGQYQTLEMADIISNLAAIDLRNRKYEQALSRLMESLAINRALLPEEHLQIAISYTNMAVILTSMDETLKAQDVLLKGILIKEKIPELDSRELHNDYLTLGHTFLDQNDLASAQWALSRAEQLQEECFNQSHPSRINTGMALFRLFMDMKQEQWAEEVISCTLELSNQIYGMNGLPNARIHYHLGIFEMSRNNCKAAMTHFKTAIVIFKPEPEKYKARLRMFDQKLQEARKACEG